MSPEGQGKINMFRMILGLLTNLKNAKPDEGKTKKPDPARARMTTIVAIIALLLFLAAGGCVLFPDSKLIIFIGVGAFILLMAVMAISGWGSPKNDD